MVLLFVSYLMVGAMFIGYPVRSALFGFGEGTLMSGRHVMSGFFNSGFVQRLLFFMSRCFGRWLLVIGALSLGYPRILYVLCSSSATY